MPWPVYSVKFIHTAQYGGWVKYTVPSGKRAVVTNLNVMNFAAAGESCSLQLNGLYAYYAVIPATNTSQQIELRQVVYAGQLIETLTHAAGMHVQVSGYLFDDVGDRQPDHEACEFEPVDRVDTLPRLPLAAS